MNNQRSNLSRVFLVAALLVTGGFTAFAQVPSGPAKVSNDEIYDSATSKGADQKDKDGNKKNGGGLGEIPAMDMPSDSGPSAADASAAPPVAPESAPASPPAAAAGAAPEPVPEPQTAPPQAPAAVGEGAQSETGGESASGDLNASDERNEARFARIYKKFNRKEISDDEWAKIAGERSTESYVLQEGDTLWDISTKFFGNGFYWPKIWQLNDQITNPHNIKVGNTLKFLPGSTVAAPKLAVDQSGDGEEQGPEGAPNEGGEAVAESGAAVDDTPEVDTINVESATSGSEVSKEIFIPPPKRRTSRAAKIPPSFAAWFGGSGGYDENGFSTDVKVINRGNSSKPSAVGSLILSRRWDSDGKIIDTEGSFSSVATYQNVLVELKQPVQPGQVLTVYSDNGTVDDPITGSSMGREIQTRGEMSVLEGIQGSSGVYRAMVSRLLMPIRIGDLIKVGKHTEYLKFDQSGPASVVSARILDGELGNRAVFGLYNVVFLNRGSQDGLQVGSLLSVIKNIRLRRDSSRLNFDPKPIGTLKVAQVTDHLATAVIVAEREAILPGDETGIARVTAANSEPQVDSDNPDGGDGVDAPPQTDEDGGNP